MTMLQEDLDLTVLWSGEVSCEMEHRETVCTITVTHRETYACGGSALVCTSAARHTLELLENSWYLCLDCKRPCRECWAVHPV